MSRPVPALKALTSEMIAISDGKITGLEYGGVDGLGRARSVIIPRKGNARLLRALRACEDSRLAEVALRTGTAEIVVVGDVRADWGHPFHLAEIFAEV